MVGDHGGPACVVREDRGEDARPFVPRELYVDIGRVPPALVEEALEEEIVL